MNDYLKLLYMFVLNNKKLNCANLKNIVYLKYLDLYINIKYCKMGIDPINFVPTEKEQLDAIVEKLSK